MIFAVIDTMNDAHLSALILDLIFGLISALIPFLILALISALIPDNSVTLFFPRILPLILINLTEWNDCWIFIHCMSLLSSEVNNLKQF